MTNVAVIDVGTVTARLAIAEVANGRMRSMTRQSTIVNLGEGVDRTRRLLPEAVRRLLACVDEYLVQIREAQPEAVVCTLTSASRDAENAEGMLAELAARGLSAQVIPGEVEGKLTFLGVAQDFGGQRLLVADNGGGSTEFVLGKLGEDGELKLDFVRSIDVGCRRVTEKFLSREDPPTDADVAGAHEFAAAEFAALPLFAPESAQTKPQQTNPLAGAQSVRLVVTGGTATTLVALKKQLVPYDSTQVHLARLSVADVEAQEARLAGLTVAERAKLPGIQAKRAPVMLGGTVAVREIMRVAGANELTVSESDLLVGLSLTVAAAVEGAPSPVGWAPQLT